MKVLIIKLVKMVSTIGKIIISFSIFSSMNNNDVIIYI